MRRTILLGAVLAALTAPVGPAAAQTLDSSLRAECVGGVIGCSQVDFFLDLADLTASTTLDFFRVSVSSSGWSFLSFVEGYDAIGELFVDSYGGGATAEAQFGVFPALVEPTLRLRAEMDAYGDDAALLAFEYEGGTFQGDAEVLAVQGGSTVTPEPVSMVLLGTGLAGMVAARRRRRTPGEA